MTPSVSTALVIMKGMEYWGGMSVMKHVSRKAFVCKRQRHIRTETYNSLFMRKIVAVKIRQSLKN